MSRMTGVLWIACIMTMLVTGCGGDDDPSAGDGTGLTDAQVEDIVTRSYPYVALYNVIQKAALDDSNPVSTGGFNKLFAATTLFDHNVKSIARPNNDSLYITCMMALRKDAVADPTSKALLRLRLRYKHPEGSTSTLLEEDVLDDDRDFAAADRDFRWAAAVAAFGMLLRDSEHKGSASFRSVEKLALEGAGADKHGYRAEFFDLVQKAEALVAGSATTD